MADFASSVEVNVGNIAACAPIIKPFVHYIRAVISGRDPRELRGRRSNWQSSRHIHWYSRMWTPRTKPDTVNDHHPSISPQTPKVEGPVRYSRWQPFHFGTRLPTVKDDTPVSVSLELPLQGTTRKDESDRLESGLRDIDSDATIWSDKDRVWGVQGRI